MWGMFPCCYCARNGIRCDTHHFPNPVIASSLSAESWWGIDRHGEPTSLSGTLSEVIVARRRSRSSRKTSSGLRMKSARIMKHTKPRSPSSLHEPVITVVAPTQDARRYASHTVRMNTLNRDGFKCRYCGVSVTNDTANMDHVVPWKKGGKTRSRNLVTACKPCNKKKGNKAWKPNPLSPPTSGMN